MLQWIGRVYIFVLVCFWYQQILFNGIYNSASVSILEEGKTHLITIQILDLTRETHFEITRVSLYEVVKIHLLLVWIQKLKVMIKLIWSRNKKKNFFYNENM